MKKTLIIITTLVLIVGLAGFWYAFRAPAPQAVETPAPIPVATTDKPLCPAFSAYIKDLAGKVRDDTVNHLSYGDLGEYAHQATGNHLAAMQACPKE